MLSKICVAICSLILFLTIQLYSEDLKTDSLRYNLEQIIYDEMSQWNWTGVSVAVIYQNGIILNKGFGFSDIEKEIPMTEKTILPIASLTKTFTATMYMQLIENKLIGFNSNVITFVPVYKTISNYPDYGNTTLLQLATHSSGLPKDSPLLFWSHFEDFLWVILNGNFHKQTKVDREEFIKSLSSIHLAAIPNARFIYSNLGYALLGMALEKACGVTYQEYIKKNIFQPLAMNNSGFYSDFSAAQNLAVCYVILPNNPKPLAAPAYECDEPNSPFIPAGGIYSTAEDMAKFLMFHINGNPPVLKNENIELMQSQHYGGFGIGWDINKMDQVNTLSHSGGGLAFNAYMIAVPEIKTGIVILRNCAHPYGTEGSVDKLASKLIKKCIAVALEDIDINKKNSMNDIQRYAGTYRTSLQNATAIITINGNRINMQLKEAPDFKEDFIPINAHEFHFLNDPFKKPMLFFQEDESGNIISLKFLSFLFYKEM
jgi:CubicO group peptidase (beta-lactamase class C family)